MIKWLLTYLLPFLLLQALAGFVDVRMFAFPVGLALALALFALLFVLDREYGDSRWMRCIRSSRMACDLLALLVVWCVVGGSLPHRTMNETPGVLMSWLACVGLTDFPVSWPFVALLVALMSHLYLLLLHRLHTFSFPRDAAFLLIHSGLLIALFGGVVGAGDVRELRAIVNRETPIRQAFEVGGRVEGLSYELQLREFVVESNPSDGSPVQYRATLLVDNRPVSLAVNAPYSVRMGEDIYLMSFDRPEESDESLYCVLQIVRQPWKYPMLGGLLLLLAGVGWMLVKLK